MGSLPWIALIKGTQSSLLDLTSLSLLQIALSKIPPFTRVDVTWGGAYRFPHTVVHKNSRPPVKIKAPPQCKDSISVATPQFKLGRRRNGKSFYWPDMRVLIFLMR
jgi:hypothetical protein